MVDEVQTVLAIADELEFIREQWKIGDNEIDKSLRDGGTSAQLSENEYLMIANRRLIIQAITQLRTKTIQNASVYLDSQLKTDLRDLLDHLIPVDTHLSNSPKWRLAWSELETDTRLENLVEFVRAASRNTVQTKRSNLNRRVGEERVTPHELNDFCRNPKVIRSGCYNIANLLPMIRDDWQAGDVIDSDWKHKGWSTIGDHFLSEKRGSRYEVDRLLNKIVSDIGPVVFPHLDASLRSRLILFCQNVRPYETTNVHGDRGERWHLRWDELNLDDDVAMLGLELRASGDASGLASDRLHKVGKQTHPTYSERTYFPSSWFNLVTDEGLYPDLLKKAVHDKRLVGSLKRNGRWQHDANEVADLFSSYKATILTALASGQSG